MARMHRLRKEQVRFMKITQNVITMSWGAHAPSRAGDGALAIANFLGEMASRDCSGQKLCREGAAKSTRGRVRSPELSL